MIIIKLQIDIHDFHYISLCHTCNIITSFFFKAFTKKKKKKKRIMIPELVALRVLILKKKKNDLKEKETEWLINYMNTKDTIT